MLRWKTALDGGFGIGFVAHLALNHADEVGREDAPDYGKDAGDYGALESGEGTLQDLVYDVHDVVDGGGDVGCIGRYGL